MPSARPIAPWAPVGLSAGSSSSTDETQLQAAPASTGATSLRIVYNNDTHEKFKAMPYLISAFRALSEQGYREGKDVLRLSGGDNNVGRESAEWRLSVKLLNFIKYHAATMGNHELDTGSQGYAEGLKEANFPTLVSNLHIPAGSPLEARLQDGTLQKGPLVVREGQGTYGIIGVTTPKLFDVLSKSARLTGEAPYSWEDTVKTVQNQVRQLEAQGVNKIILESHMGTDDDQALVGLKPPVQGAMQEALDHTFAGKLAETVNGIDIIASAHDHKKLQGFVPGVNYFRKPSGETIVEIEAGKNAQCIGVADVDFDAAGRVLPRQNVLLNPLAFAPDPQALALEYAVLGVPKTLAVFTTSYDGTDNDFHPDAVAQFAADAMRAAIGTDIAFVRSPEVRNNFEPGSFTDQDLKALMPFTDPVVRLPLTGMEILNALHRSAECLKNHESHPGMLQAAGMALEMDKRSGLVTRARVFNRSTGQWEALNPFKTYQVAMGEFALKNGREFPSLAHPERIQWNSGRPVRDFFAWGLQQAGAPGQPIGFHDDGRLQII
jgi:2',3'-cyclic-nucleotide 2'-phosphodiesterase (5'-nucleotidase family)